MGRAIGAHIGEVIEVDNRGIEQERGRYVRVKVRLNTDKPVKRGGMVPLRMSKIQVVYRYEKIGDVCLYCGFLGHKSQGCEQRYVDVANGCGRGNKYDKWMLVHGESREQLRRREERRGRFWRQDDEEGRSGSHNDRVDARYRHDDMTVTEAQGDRGEIKRKEVGRGEQTNEGTSRFVQSKVRTLVDEQEGAIQGKTICLDRGESSTPIGMVEDADRGREKGIMILTDNIQEGLQKEFNSKQDSNSRREVLRDIGNMKGPTGGIEAPKQSYVNVARGLHEIRLVEDKLQDVEVKCGRVTKRGWMVNKNKEDKEDSAVGTRVRLETRGSSLGSKRRRKEEDDKGDNTDTMYHASEDRNFKHEGGDLFTIGMGEKGRGVLEQGRSKNGKGAMKKCDWKTQGSGGRKSGILNGDKANAQQKGKNGKGEQCSGR